jgi:hypothetical protein
MLISRFFEDVPPGAVFVFGGQWDIDGSRRYRHKIHHWEIAVTPHALENINWMDVSDGELDLYIDGLAFSAEAKRSVAAVAKHIRSNYESVALRGEVLPELMRAVFSRVPVGSKIVLLVDHVRVRTTDGEVVDAPWARTYGEQIRAIAKLYPFVAVVSFGDYVHNDGEIHIGGNHYDRMVYYRMAEGVASAIRAVPARATSELPNANSSHLRLISKKLRVEGFVELFSKPRTFAGWAAAPDLQASENPQVALYFDGILVGKAERRYPRPDVVGLGKGPHGFLIHSEKDITFRDIRDGRISITFGNDRSSGPLSMAFAADYALVLQAVESLIEATSWSEPRFERLFARIKDDISLGQKLRQRAIAVLEMLMQADELSSQSTIQSLEIHRRSAQAAAGSSMNCLGSDKGS